MYQLENIAEISQRTAGTPLSSLAECDSRADGGHREIFCSPHHVAIKRRVQGIAMQLEVPARSYMGVVLSIFTGRDGLPFYRISMPHPDADLAIVLFEARDDRDILAVWKAWARYFALPKLLERRPGELECETNQIGALAMGLRPLWRRRGGSLAKRKPKLLNRRRNAHVSLKPVVETALAAMAMEV